MAILRHYLYLFFISMVPIVELRGAVPAGIATGLPVLPVFLVCVCGNLLPVPLIMLFIRRLLAFMKRFPGLPARAAAFVERKAEKGARLFYRYEMLGLWLLVAIPLPGTGAWTGALVAAMLNMRIRNAFPLIALGVITAGIIMMLLSLGVSSVL